MCFKNVMGSVSPLVLARSPQIKTFTRIILSVLPVRGTQCWRNTKFIQCKVNIYRCKCQAGCDLAGMTHSAGTCLCACLTSRWRPKSLSLKESGVTYFAITRVCHWVGTCTVNGWQLTRYKFTTKFIPINQFCLFREDSECFIPRDPLLHYNGRSSIISVWT